MPPMWKPRNGRWAKSWRGLRTLTQGRWSAMSGSLNGCVRGANLLKAKRRDERCLVAACDRQLGRSSRLHCKGQPAQRSGSCPTNPCRCGTSVSTTASWKARTDSRNSRIGRGGHAIRYPIPGHERQIGITRRISRAAAMAREALTGFNRALTSPVPLPLQSAIHRRRGWSISRSAAAGPGWKLCLLPCHNPKALQIHRRLRSSPA